MSIAGDKSILDSGKYMMQIGSKWYPIPSTVTFEPTYNNMAVIITIPAEAKYDTTNYVKDVTISEVKVTYVADKNGNMLADYTQELSPAIDTGATMITNTDADYYPYASAKDTVVVTFDRPLQYVNYKDFIVGNGAYTVTKATYQTVDGKGVVTLKISSNTPLPAAANTVTVKTLSDSANIRSLDILGNKIAVNTIGDAVVDEIAPSLIATYPVVATAYNEIRVYTDEPLQIAPNTTDVSASFIVTYGYDNKALTPGSDYTASVSGNNVVITLINKSLQNLVNLKVATNDNIKLVYDKAVVGDITNSNALSFTAKTVTNMNSINTPLYQALYQVNNTTDYTALKTIIENNSSLLGLDLTAYNKLDSTTGQVGGRQLSVMNDLIASKPTTGYTLVGLQNAFNEIVATRTVFQNSMNIVNAATADKPLTDISYVTMLIDNLKTVQYYTMHSGTTIAAKITQLQGYVTRYNALTAAQQTAVLKKVSSADYESSTQTLNALDPAMQDATKL